MISVFVYFLTLVMAFTPVATATESAGVDINVYDLRIILNGETYVPGVDARLRASADGQGVLAEGWLDLEGDRLFAWRAAITGDGSVLQMDGVEKSFNVNIADLMNAGSIDDETYETYANSYTEMQESLQALLRSCGGGEEEFAYLKDMIDRGEPAESETMLPGGVLTPATKYVYTISRDDVADMLECMLSGEGDMSRALNRYLNALSALSDSSMSADLPALIRDGDFEFSADVTEYEAEDLSKVEMVLHYTYDDDAFAVEISTLETADTQSAQVSWNSDGTTWTLTAESMIDAADENGDRQFGCHYDITAEYDAEVIGTVALSCGGIKHGEEKLDADFSVSYNSNSESISFQLLGSLVADRTADVEIARPEGEQVSLSDAGIIDLLEAAEAQLQADAQKLTQVEDIARITEALSYAGYEEVEDEYEYEIESLGSIEEAEEITGYSIPFGDTLLGYSAKYIEASGDWASITYTNEDDPDTEITVILYSAYDNGQAFCHLDESGKLVKDEDTVFCLYGDGDAYNYVTWTQDGIDISIDFFKGADLDTINAAIQAAHDN